MPTKSDDFSRNFLFKVGKGPVGASGREISASASFAMR